MKKRNVMVALLAGVMTVALVGCGSGNGNEESGAKEAAGGKVVIKIALQDDETGGFQKTLDGFNESQDKYEVQWQKMPNDSAQMRDQLNTSLSAGSSEYDVISMDVVWAGDMAAAGYLEPIDSYMKESGRSISEYNKGSMDSGNYQGKQYTLPFYPDSGFLFYRADIVSEEDAAKLVSGDYTWDDLASMASTYKGQGGTTTGFVYQSAQYEGLVCNLNEFSANFTDVKGGLETMKKFMDNGLTASDILNYQENEAMNSFLGGESVFMRNWPFVWGTAKENGTLPLENIGIAPLPNGGSVGGWLLGINSNSENKEGAWALLEYMASEEGNKIMTCEVGNIPGYNSLLDDEDVKSANELFTKEGFVNGLEVTISRPISDNYSELSDTIQQEAHKYLSGSQDVDTTAAKIESALSQ